MGSLKNLCWEEERKTLKKHIRDKTLCVSLKYTTCEPKKKKVTDDRIIEAIQL